MGLGDLLRLPQRFTNEFEAQQARTLYVMALLVLIGAVLALPSS